MNNNKRTTRELAIGWFNSKASLEKTRLCDTNTEIVGTVRRWETLTGREIELIYLSEHPTETETKKEKGKEGDILEGNKGAKWYLIPNSFKPMGELRDCIMIEMDMNVINDLEEENKSLREANQRLKEALIEMMKGSEENPNIPGDWWQRMTPTTDSLKKAKQALNP